MMIVPAGVKVHLALGYTDMRKRMDGLAMLVQETLKKDPFCGHLFAFRGERAQIVKVYAREQRPWSGPEPPAAVYLFAPGRKAERPASHLEDFKSVLHVDGYAGFERLTGKGDVVLAACWAHTRRKFYEVAEAIGSPVAAEALRRVGGLYVIEARVRGQSSAHRLAERRSFSRPIVQALHAWLEAQLPRVAGRSTLAEAIRYALALDPLPPRWPHRARHQSS
jgi:hypothetical protein